MNTNLRGVFYCMRSFAPLMIRARSGHIVNISSLAGKNALPNGAAYAASKWGLNGLSYSVAEELRGHNIRVSVVCPGSVHTDLSPHEGKDPRRCCSRTMQLMSWPCWSRSSRNPSSAKCCCGRRKNPSEPHLSVTTGDFTSLAVARIISSRGDSNGERAHENRAEAQPSDHARLRNAEKYRKLLPWEWAEQRLRKSHNYWITTAKPDGTPHTMVVWGLWLEEHSGSARAVSRAKPGILQKIHAAWVESNTPSKRSSSKASPKSPQ